MSYNGLNTILNCVLTCPFVSQDEEEDGEPKGKKSKISNNAKGKAPSPKKNANKK